MAKVNNHIKFDVKGVGRRKHAKFKADSSWEESKNDLKLRGIGSN